ncbi:MAG: thiamine pyrophosphate-dependent dehydrogenase E1 component subunit alpha [Planctomycetota bacterium]|nr:thiamine pyrophosphate-dependent dehydrogenase E1 component subunit alpha [Planctomycetota bacterium]
MTDQTLTREQLSALYRTMLRIRRFEETVADVVENREISTPCHFCIGQEAPPTGVCAALNDDDSIWGAHRSHGHYLAKGGDMRALMAEIFCRSTGCSKGRGGSMHVCAPEVGVMGTVPIVAATIPIAVGAALAEKLRGRSRVSVSFFGDGATEEGHFHESLNLACVNQLPVIFVCENNLYSSHMGIFERRRKDNIPDSGTAHGLPTLSVDGNNIGLVYASAVNAVERARAGDGPTLIEYRTFRWRGHVGPSWDEDVGVKRKDEIREWLERDPIKHCERRLQTLGVEQSEFDGVAADVVAEVQDALKFARQSPKPSASEVLQHVYRAA